MRLVFSASMVFGVALLATPALAQAPAIANPTPGCKATPAEIEATRQAGIAFSRQGATPAERVALADPSYKQHNPAFVKGGREAGLSDYDYFKSRFGGPPQAGRQGGGPPAQAGPTPPQGNPLEEMVREMLRPILKQWLDDHLPNIVDEHVKREIHRITGRPL